MKKKIEINDIDGILVLDKPKDYTSNDCLSILKKTFHPRKIGHTGTLDKNATGVLVCLFGNATKCQDYLMKSGEKIYEAELILGISTDTEDITGNIVNINTDYKFDIKNLENIMKFFIGDYLQTPPMYSSKKIDGSKLLNLARRGIEVDRKPCKVSINNIEIKKYYDFEFNGHTLKKIDFTVSCSKGTYIRTLCKDIGDKLNIPSCMGDLRRIKNGNFNIDESTKLEDIINENGELNLGIIKPCFYKEKKSVVTFGKFETLHIGHKKIIETTVNIAKNNNLESTCIIVGSNSDNCILKKPQRISRLKYWGIDNIVEFPLNETNKNIEAAYFVEEILINQLKAKCIVVGDDAHFGKDATGDIELLKKISKEHNIELIVIERIKNENNEVISSTLIFEKAKAGNLTNIENYISR